MSKIRLVVLSALMTVSANAYDIESYCKSVSDAIGGSYQIEKTCRNQEYQAKKKIDSMSVPQRIENYCNEVGQAIGGSYQIKLTCIKQELKAKNSLY